MDPISGIKAVSTAIGEVGARRAAEMRAMETGAFARQGLQAPSTPTMSYVAPRTLDFGTDLRVVLPDNGAAPYMLRKHPEGFVAPSMDARSNLMVGPRANSGMNSSSIERIEASNPNELTRQRDRAIEALRSLRTTR